MFTTLTDPAFVHIDPFDINNNGRIVGETDLGPFFYSNGVYTTFANGTNVEAFGINDADQIVGRLNNLGQTPLPAALPLFAAGLGMLGLLGWRRKRKAVAAYR